MMSKKEGIVVSINGKYANLLTPYGEFIKVKYNGEKPNIGERFKGNEISHNFFKFSTKKIAAAACITFILLLGGGAKAYYSPVATVLVSINPRIELKVNFLNKIISSKALNSDGSKILSEVKINNVNINDGLESIIDQSQKDKFIDGNYIKVKTISVDINGKSIDISKFKSSIEASNLSVKIQSNGDVVLNKNSNKNTNTNKTINKTTNNNSNNNEKTNNSSSTLNKDDSLNNKNYDKMSNSVNKNNLQNENNSSKQLQNSDINKTKENEGSSKKVDTNKPNQQDNNSNKDSKSKQNSNTDKQNKK